MQGLGGLVDGDQRRTAGGVDCHGRALQAQGEGDAAGDGVQRVTGDEVGLEVFHRIAREQMGVLVGAHADEHAASAAAQGRRRVSGAFEPLPGDFEHQPLLWVDPHRFAGRDTEELGVEGVDAVEVSAVAGVDLAGRLLVGVVELVDVEPVLGNFPDRVDTAGEQLPVRIGVRCPWEPAGDRDDRDRFVGGRRGQRDRLRLGAGSRPVVELEDVTEQVVGNIGQARVIHRQRRRKLLAHCPFQAAPQLDRHQ